MQTEGGLLLSALLKVRYTAGMALKTIVAAPSIAKARLSTICRFVREWIGLLNHELLRTDSELF